MFALVAMWPPYSYVPGKFPHPLRDPRGHSYKRSEEPVPPPEPARWRECSAYTRGIDLFNRGYYWEAHETWEAAWIAASRQGTTADFLKGLIKLAAAGVKAREGRPRGVERHARRADQLFQSVARDVPDPSRFMGLNLADLRAAAGRLAADPESVVDDRDQPVVQLMPFSLASR